MCVRARLRLPESSNKKALHNNNSKPRAISNWCVVFALDVILTCGNDDANDTVGSEMLTGLSRQSYLPFENIVSCFYLDRSLNGFFCLNRRFSQDYRLNRLRQRTPRIEIGSDVSKQSIHSTRITFTAKKSYNSKLMICQGQFKLYRLFNLATRKTRYAVYLYFVYSCALRWVFAPFEFDMCE